MKGIKGFTADVVAYILLALTPIGIIQYRAYNSEFVQVYNGAVQRNADTNDDGKITPIEELRFKQSLIEEIAELRKQGRNLDDIVVWLKNK